jgi:hypothetical protein
VRSLFQLSETAADLAAGAFAPLGVDSSKPVVAAVVTFGGIPFVNSEMFYEKILLRKAAEKARTALSPNFGIKRRPFVMSLVTLERFVTAMNNFRETPLQLYETKESQPYVALGDWDQHLAVRLNGLGANLKRLRLVTEQFDEFFDSMGIPPDDRPKLQSRPEQQ